MLNQLRSDEDRNIIEQGFTLVELLIVIVILGILAGIVVFAVGNLTNSTKTSSCQTEVSSFTTAYNAFKAAAKGSAPGKGTADAAGRDSLMEDLTNKNSLSYTGFSAVAGYPSANAANGPFLTNAPIASGANGYWDVADSTTAALFIQNNVNNAAIAAKAPAWAFDPVTGNTLTSQASSGYACQ